MTAPRCWSGSGCVIAFGRLETSLAASVVASEAKRKIDSLSPRERDVMGHLFDGKVNRATASIWASVRGRWIRRTSHLRTGARPAQGHPVLRAALA